MCTDCTAALRFVSLKVDIDAELQRYKVSAASQWLWECLTHCIIHRNLVMQYVPWSVTLCSMSTLLFVIRRR